MGIEQLDFTEMRAQWALKAPVPSKEQIDMQGELDRQANPHNDPYLNKKPRRSRTEIISDLSFAFADGVLFSQYGEAYIQWLNRNSYRIFWGVIRYASYAVDAERGTAISPAFFRTLY